MRILIGGSPCTYWSIAQTKSRETTAEGLGWELFKNYLIAKEKFKPDLFLYENNKSAAQPIKDQIKQELKVYDGTFLMQDSGARYIEIDSALVSAQHRERFYVHNCGEVQQPQDRGILLPDILENQYYAVRFLTDGEMAYLTRNEMNSRFMNYGDGDKSHCVTANFQRGVPYNCVAVPVSVKACNDRNMEHLMRPFGAKGHITSDTTKKSPTLMAAAGTGGGNSVYYAEPVVFSNPHGFNVGGAKREKAPTLTANGRWTDNNHLVLPVIAEPAVLRYERTEQAKACRKDYEAGRVHHGYHEMAEMHPRTDGKSNTLTTVQKDNMLIEPVIAEKAELQGGIKQVPIYEVKDGQITIKSKRYPIKLPDGYYIIRKLTVKECCRLQTMPDDYCRAVSDSQAYKGLGNGWTAEVIIHILGNALNAVPKDEPITVLSMYDGIGTGRYCLDKLGFKNVRYYAYEIDKYAMKIALSNYPDIVQMGDAFQLRQADWGLPKQ